MKLFSGSSNTSLGHHIAEKLGVALSPVDVHIFPDGERRIRVSENVVGEHCWVVQSANTPVDTNYMELFFLIDALKRNGAEFVTAIVPYFGYQRQDHIFRDGEAVSLEVVINILERLGIDRLVSLDMHSVKIPDLFTVPVNHLSALPLFASVIPDLIRNPGIDFTVKGTSVARLRGNDNNMVLVSPDMGGIARIKKISELLDNMPFAVVEKNRDRTTGDITSGGIAEGSLAGKKHAILVDDMIASGKTMILAADELKKHGVEEVTVFATHAIFSEGAPKRLQESSIDTVFVTDTVQVPEDKQFAKLKILTVSDIIAEEMQRIMNKEL